MSELQHSPVAVTHPIATVGQLHCHAAVVEAGGRTSSVAERFEQQATLPGIIVLQNRQLKGLIPRARFLKRLSHKFWPELFLPRPIAQVSEVLRTDPLVIGEERTIADASNLALQRSGDAVFEPLIVQRDVGSLELLDVALDRGTLELPRQLRGDDLATYYELVRIRQDTAPCKDRSITLRVEYSATDLVLEVADQGAGFDADHFLNVAEAAVIERPYGRGILLMRTVMDEVEFLDGGRVARLVKKRESLVQVRTAAPDDDVFNATDLSDSAFLLDLGGDGLDEGDGT